MQTDFGKVYLVSTPIGNLEDITFRALKTLEMVDLIAAEDTRQTIKLLNHFKIKKKMISYFEHNKLQKGEYLISLCKSGLNIALVSDAGTPGISDPGEELVLMCRKENIVVVPIPGPTAFVSALVCSGLPTGRFVFEGFLPVNKRSKLARIQLLKNEIRTIIFYEAPHKLKATLLLLADQLGDREIVLARELTKLHEEFITTTLAAANTFYEKNAPKGEFVIILKGSATAETDTQEVEEPDPVTICRQIDAYIKAGMAKNQAIKQVSKEFLMDKRQIYALCRKNIMHI